MAITNKQKQVKEIIRCGKDPVYFMQKYVKIQHPTRGLIPFETYPFQEDCVGDFENYLKILKSVHSSDDLNMLIDEAKRDVGGDVHTLMSEL